MVLSGFNDFPLSILARSCSESNSASKRIIRPTRTAGSSLMCRLTQELDTSSRSATSATLNKAREFSADCESVPIGTRRCDFFTATPAVPGIQLDRATVEREMEGRENGSTVNGLREGTPPWGLPLAAGLRPASRPVGLVVCGVVAFRRVAHSCCCRNCRKSG